MSLDEKLRYSAHFLQYGAGFSVGCRVSSPPQSRIVRQEAGMKHTKLHEQPGWTSGGVVMAPAARRVDSFDDNPIDRKPPM